MSLRSPMSKVLGLGAAKQGASHWWSQRVSAVGLTLLMPWLLLSLISLGDLGYAAVTTWIAMPVHAVLLTVLVITMTYHAQLGLQVVIEDYVAGKSLKTLAMLVINFALIVLGGLGLFAVLRIALVTASMLHTTGFNS